MIAQGLIPRLSVPTLIFFSISVQFLIGGANGSSATKNVAKDQNRSITISGGQKVLLICLGIVAFVGFLFFLCKLYQKKKREEQHARLLRLFEDNDELELELGLRESRVEKIRLRKAIERKTLVYLLPAGVRGIFKL